MSDVIRGHYHLSRAWYGESNLKGMDYTDAVNIGLYEPEGGTDGEFSIKWYELQSLKRPAPRLEVFDDGWRVFHEMGLAEHLAELDSQNPTPEDICTLLDSLGFTDLTPVESPYA